MFLVLYLLITINKFLLIFHCTMGWNPSKYMFLGQALNQTVNTMAATVSIAGACMYICLYMYRMFHYTCMHMPKSTFARTTKSTLWLHNALKMSCFQPRWFKSGNTWVLISSLKECLFIRLISMFVIDIFLGRSLVYTSIFVVGALNSFAPPWLLAW